MSCFREDLYALALPKILYILKILSTLYYWLARLHLQTIDA